MNLSNLKTKAQIEKFRQNDFLLDYLHDRLGAEERLAFEEQLAEDEMLQDALEGLRTMEEEAVSLDNIQVQFKDFLSRQTKYPSDRSKKIVLGHSFWTTLIIVLLLVMLAGVYLYLHQLKQDT